MENTRIQLEFFEKQTCKLGYELIRDILRPRKVAKKQVIANEGSMCRSLIFIVKGAMRLYSIDDKGRQHTMYLACDNQWISDFESFGTNLTSGFTIEAVEDCELLIISADRLKAELTRNPGLAHFLNDIYREITGEYQRRILSLIGSSAEERYETFSRSYPHIIGRLPQTVIASYLGLCPETVSRIKNKLLTENSVISNRLKLIAC
ncbi:cyclic nucleotide-binding domain-containing protein [Pedobacter sp. HMF7647]|uniref:Cyclic nucleotide-binding domain-containing protein n=1 Tax=Hufsiella arboris TaxID=2695275 RepID=A0A7K1Y8C7_9SPHI|nr:Crp/Fnr family transcriptional regulator [Hufsiella arboris]MXV50621.1 cyclic nucleotide-binding domain-containing protein [Hufsiella arboris]